MADHALDMTVEGAAASDARVVVVPEFSAGARHEPVVSP